MREPEKFETKLILEDEIVIICHFCKSRNVFIRGTSRFPFNCINCDTEITEAHYLEAFKNISEDQEEN